PRRRGEESTMMRFALRFAAVFPAALFCCAAASSAQEEAALFRHSPDWIRARLRSMHAVDDAYLWHDVLGGRAIHQNSKTTPPVEPLEGNFHTQQQAFFALMKLHLYEVLGETDPGLLDDAKALLDWVLDNGYDAPTARFYFRYNERRGEWHRGFYPEFNMITVAALLRYNAVRPTPRYSQVADAVFDTIIRVGWDAEHGGFCSGFSYNPETGAFEGDRNKGLYAPGYLAVMMLDAYDVTGEPRFLAWAKKAVDACNNHLWDDEYGAWRPGANRQWDRFEGSTKLTHVIADLVQANYLLYLKGQGDAYRDYAERALAFLVEYCRAPNGLWYRHTTRDGSDPRPGPDVSADGGPGTCLPYDRQMQAIAACCLGYRATGNARYLEYVDDTLDAMETSHRIDYPAGINYGYMGQDNAQNTWCHLWGLKGFLAIARVQAGDGR
ncbi:MAG: AGE family epimerase/isomerase, partial [Candidatus Hydrogenedentes bacterium]|nr:AGE family epimerase/isomerase [Candidatus Hydrogenedentota bacterium]